MQGSIQYFDDHDDPEIKWFRLSIELHLPDESDDDEWQTLFSLEYKAEELQNILANDPTAFFDKVRTLIEQTYQ